MKKVSELLKNSKYLSKVMYIVHVFDEIENFNNPQSVFVEFDSIIGITFRCGSNGESIIYEEGSPEFVEINMGEFGRELSGT
jgi:endonuclease IV